MRLSHCILTTVIDSNASSSSRVVERVVVVVERDDYRTQPALAAMVMGWLWGRPEQ